MRTPGTTGPAEQIFDYVIVGAGSAGCVLAYRLSACSSNDVAVVEAGPDVAGGNIAMPMGFVETLNDAALTWRFPAEHGRADRPSSRLWVRGKVVGGSSSINGMIYCRGHAADYDAWEAAGLRGWGWSQMERCFHAIERHDTAHDGVAPTRGLVSLERQSHRSPLTKAVLDAAAAIGLAQAPDVACGEGIGYTPVTMDRRRRVSAADAFLRPARGRRNLHVIANVTAQRVRFEGRRAVGVHCQTGSGTLVLRARREVILCTGAIHSPKLLQLSGVGDAQHLRSLGIPVVHDSPGVGQNLREHKVMTIQVRLRNNWSHNFEFAGFRRYRNLLRYGLFRTGPFASTCDLIGFVNTEAGLRRPDAQVTFWSLSLDREARGWKLERQPGASATVYPLRPESRGSITIRSPSPLVPPLIRPNFLAADYDRKVTVGAFRWLRRLFQRAELSSFVESETYPGHDVTSAEDILEVCRQDGNCSHAVGTCRMGADGDAVVDEQLRVRGVSGLRVVDASVMPTQVSGNPNGPVFALAWRAADLILPVA